MGFELEKFQNPNSIDEELICPICLGVFENPLEINSCQHIFCTICILESIQKGNNHCPIDRQLINDGDLREPRSIKRIIENLKIKCDYTTEGCQSIVTIESLSRHHDQCEFNPNNFIECQCGLTVKKIDLTKHNCVEVLLNINKELRETIKQKDNEIERLKSSKTRINLVKNIKEEHLRMVQNLKSIGVIKSDKIEKSMNQVDRGNYCNNNPYDNKPQRIDFGVNISAPHMHAHALEILKDHLYEGAKGLDIGSGSGYLTSCMGVLVGERGVAVGIDINPDVVNLSIENIKKDQPNLIESGCIKMRVGNGIKGYLSNAPYDAIHVGAAVKVLPQALINQLKPGGRLVIPIEKDSNQNLEQIDKLPNGTIKRMSLMGVIYGYLIDDE